MWRVFPIRREVLARVRAGRALKHKLPFRRCTRTTRIEATACMFETFQVTPDAEGPVKVLIPVLKYISKYIHITTPAVAYT